MSAFDQALVFISDLNRTARNAATDAELHARRVNRGSVEERYLRALARAHHKCADAYAEALREVAES